MKVRDKLPTKYIRSIGLGLAGSVLMFVGSLTAQENRSIKIDGSSTVYPITQKIVQDYRSNKKQSADIKVDFSGTGGGFDKFCRGETDISNASRPITAEEMEACNDSEVRYIELPVAFDALTVVINPQNNWLENITTEELNKIWSPKAKGKITNWNQVRSSFPDKPLNLYAPGEDSGTFEYFTEAVIGEAGASRNDVIKSEDDDVLVRGVSQDVDALGYFGLAYYEQHTEELKAVGVDSGNGAVMPSIETVEQAKYQPLSRPLFIYVNAASAQKNPDLRDFIDYYLAQAPQLVTEVGYVPLPEEAYNINKVSFHKG